MTRDPPRRVGLAELVQLVLVELQVDGGDQTTASWSPPGEAPGGCTSVQV